MATTAIGVLVIEPQACGRSDSQPEREHGALHAVMCSNS
jgi:hypothetical protein